MSQTYTVTDLEVTIDQADHPELNYAAFIAHVDVELKKFIQLVASYQSDFISPQDVGPMGITCRFHSINGFPAVRQMNQYNPSTKTYFIWFDCRLLTAVVAGDASEAAKLEPMDPTPAPTDLPPAAANESEVMH